MMRKIILSLLLLLPLWSVGQISVKSFKKLPTDMTARTYEPKRDQNGELCAIIKVVTTEKEFGWDPDGFGIVDAPYKIGEYWIYLPGGAQRLTIKHPRLGVLRNYHYPEPIEKGCVYEMVLTTAKITTIVEEAVSNFLLITTEPADAVIYFENNIVGTGVYQTPCKPGAYTYRVESPLYHTEAGKIEMGTEKKTLNIVLKPAFGYLNITTLPESGALITIDGKRVNGVSPLKTERLESGQHTVTVAKNMYHTATQKVTATDGQTTPVTLTMEPNFAELTVSAATAGGEIYLNNAKVGDGDWTGRVKVGLNIVEVRKPHYRTAKQEFDAAAGERKTITLEPIPIKGNLSVMTVPVNATIRIAGKEYGTTPNVITGLLEGEHTVELSKTGYATENRQIIITEGKVTEINVTLKEAATVGKQVAASGTFSCGESFTDPRDGQKYATKLMKDGQCWMVENLRFGKCDATAFGKYSKTTAKDMIASGYYGVCIASTQTGGGNLYNWQAAMNHADAVYETDGNPSGNVDGNSPTQWQGICPAGWHLPSGGSTSEFQKLYTAFENPISDITSGTGIGGWQGVLGGVGSSSSVDNAGSRGCYWSNTYKNTNSAYNLYFSGSSIVPHTNSSKLYGLAVRCIRNKDEINGSSLKQETGTTQNSKDTHSCGESFTDPRDGQKYATKLMKDGRCWMVENLRFGKCDATAFGKYSKTTAKDMIASGYYGVCIASTQTGGGNLYNWQAAMNHADAVCYTEGNPSGNIGGNSSTQWQGICPAGWHLPSGGSTGEFQKLYTALGSTDSNIYPGTGADGWRGVLGGYGLVTSVGAAGSYGYYWSSTYYITTNAYNLYFGSGSVSPQNIGGKPCGFAVRCLKNY